MKKLTPAPGAAPMYVWLEGDDTSTRQPDPVILPPTPAPNRHERRKAAAEKRAAEKRFRAAVKLSQRVRRRLAANI